MRSTSFIKQPGIALLLVALYVPSLFAQAKLPNQTAISPLQAGQSATSVSTQNSQAGLQAVASHPGETSGKVLQAGILPDAANLLPVAAIVGFSFLFGGIVSVLKTRT